MTLLFHSSTKTLIYTLHTQAKSATWTMTKSGEIIYGQFTLADMIPSLTYLIIVSQLDRVAL